MSVKRLHTYLVSVLVILMALQPASSDACTVFYIYKNGKILGGANEDWKDPNTRMWFYPASEKNHGWVKFGFSSGFPQAGMNDSGIFWDGTSNPWQDMPEAEEYKQLYDGPLMQKVMEECLDIPDAKHIFDNYYCQDQYRGQYLIGGPCGHSIIIDGDYYHENHQSYQVLTNFHQSNPDLGGYPCWRYSTATEKLEGCSSLTEYFAGGILSATHQEGNYPTQYSLIFDPVKKWIYLFNFHNFEEFLLIKLDEVLQADSCSYAIPPLFSRMNMIAPSNGDTVQPDSVILKWRGLPGSTYHVLLFDEKGRILVDASVTSGHERQNTNAHYYLAALMFPLIFFRRKIIQSSLLISVCLLLCLSCKKEDELIVEDPEVLFTEVISDLEPNMTYRWKLVMEPFSDSPFQTESVEYSFTTDALN